MEIDEKLSYTLYVAILIHLPVPARIFSHFGLPLSLYLND